MWNDVGCTVCGVQRPVWHGAPHKCKRVGQLIEFGSIGPYFISNEHVLTWLHAS